MENQFIRDLDEAKRLFPSLEYHHLPNKRFVHKVTGTFDIIDGEENHWGAFSASLYFTDSYPKGFALLKDNSRAFPWDLNWHIDEKTGLCCVCGPIEREERAAKGISILGFIEGYVIPFYANQIYKKEFGFYKNGEYAHFIEGIWEALEEEFGTSDRKQIKLMLNQMRSKRGRNEDCFCGSGIKFKKCHMNRIPYIEAAAKQISLN
ncbi:SEC-C domain-containing protein [Allomuricauda sp. NBRC 101325]|uniref:SEC-C domain-containing protein n=1 Tax=Allomuricauda sp. NBRC 101325 TaxID=1113758 RepID=UPI0024A30F20|nr:SEC-C domain-containing protein [Muricauda sp. NBRC 101325]GLU43274.1 hypothetical protein Musp01_08980 [Muricauda sp. NBRC 101325]